MLAEAKTCLSLLPSAARWRLAKLIPLTVIASFVEALGAAAVFGLVAILGNPGRAATLPGAASLYRLLPRHDPAYVMMIFTTLVVAFYLIRNVLLVFQAWIQERALSTTVNQLADRMLRHYIEAPYTFHLRHNSALLIQRMQSIPVAIRLALASLMGFASEILSAIGIVIVLLMASLPVTLTAVIAGIALIFIPLALSKKIHRRWSVAARNLEVSALQTLQQSLGSIKELTLSGSAFYFIDAFDRKQQARAHIDTSRATLSTAQRLLIETAFITVVLVVSLLVAGRHAGTEVVPLLGLYAYAGFRLLPSVNRIVAVTGYIRNAGATLADLEKDRATLQTPAVFEHDASTPLTFEQTIAFEHVSFAYEAGGPTVLREINIAIAKGESLGIVGPSGAGKSTLVDILLGLLEPSQGSVTVDGNDIRHRMTSWQRQIGYVPQEPYILDDSLQRNVAFGVPDREINRQRVEAALHDAQLSEFVAGLPEGLQTSLGERGARMSGGQRQRVAIARALYHRRDVLVFDEATSALDAETERQFKKVLDALHRTKTIIVITHRPSMVKGCDQLVMLEKGAITAAGTWNALAGRMEQVDEHTVKLPG